MVAALQTESILSGSHQATVPEALRCAAKLGARGKTRYFIRVGVLAPLTRAGELNDKGSALLQAFALLVRDIAPHPERLQTIRVSSVERIQGLVHGAALDLFAPFRLA